MGDVNAVERFQYLIRQDDPDDFWPDDSDPSDDPADEFDPDNFDWPDDDEPEDDPFAEEDGQDDEQDPFDDDGGCADCAAAGVDCPYSDSFYQVA
jgi:hypothetical protein